MNSLMYRSSLPEPRAKSGLNLARAIALRVFAAGLLLALTSGDSVLGQASRLPPATDLELPNVNHTLFGDFKVEGLEPDNLQSFQIILYSVVASGRPFARQVVTNNTRYRFNNVPNGEYFLAIESNETEVTRMHLILAEREQTDIRRDITLEVKDTTPRTATTGIASSLYVRSSRNQNRFDRAVDAGKKNNYRSAVALLTEIVENDPDDFVAWTELGTMHFMQKKHREAEQAYRRSLEKKPEYFLTLLNLGKVLMTLKNHQEATGTLTRALEINARSAEANYLLGEAYLQLRLGSRAVGYLYEAIKLDPEGMADAHLRLAALYDAAGLKDRAAKEYGDFLAKKPDHPDRKKFERYISEHRK